jgi:hypothetical protein
VIIIETAPASATPTATTKGDYWKDHITLKGDKQPQSNQSPKWKHARETPSRSQVIRCRIKQSHHTPRGNHPQSNKTQPPSPRQKRKDPNPTPRNTPNRRGEP